MLLFIVNYIVTFIDLLRWCPTFIVVVVVVTLFRCCYDGDRCYVVIGDSYIVVVALLVVVDLRCWYVRVVVVLLRWWYVAFDLRCYYIGVVVTLPLLLLLLR